MLIYGSIKNYALIGYSIEYFIIKLIKNYLEATLNICNFWGSRLLRKLKIYNFLMLVIHVDICNSILQVSLPNKRDSFI